MRTKIWNFKHTVIFRIINNDNSQIGYLFISDTFAIPLTLSQYDRLSLYDQPHLRVELDAILVLLGGELGVAGVAQLGRLAAVLAVAFLAHRADEGRRLAAQPVTLLHPRHLLFHALGGWFEFDYIIGREIRRGFKCKSLN